MESSIYVCVEKTWKRPPGKPRGRIEGEERLIYEVQMSSRMSFISLFVKMSMVASPHLASINSFTRGILHKFSGETGSYSIWEVSWGSSCRMSSLFVISNIFLRLAPVVDRQSLRIVCNRILGRSFGEFSIWEMKLRNLLIKVIFSCLVPVRCSRKSFLSQYAF